jgi:hypothetical protein
MGANMKLMERISLALITYQDTRSEKKVAAEICRFYQACDWEVIQPKSIRTGVWLCNFAAGVSTAHYDKSQRAEAIRKAAVKHFETEIKTRPFEFSALLRIEGKTPGGPSKAQACQVTQKALSALKQE